MFLDNTVNPSIVHHVMTKKGKHTEFVHIGDIIDGVLKTCRSDCYGELSQVWNLWAGAVGEVIARNTKPEAFKGRMLLVHVNSPPWMHQLQFLKKDIIKKINSALGNDLVNDIIFKIGPVS